MGFPLTHLNNNNVTKIYEYELPGSHADIGGGYPNLYSRYPLAMAHGFLMNSGIPIKPLCRFAPPPLTNSMLRLHDSAVAGSWRIDMWLDSVYRKLSI